MVRKEHLTSPVNLLLSYSVSLFLNTFKQLPAVFTFVIKYIEREKLEM